MKPQVIFPDAEALALDLLTALLAGDDCTVAIGKPVGWTVDSTTHVQVALDGTPIVDHPVAARATIRVTVWARNPSDAKALAARAMGLFNASPMVRPLTGILPARDAGGAELASFTSRLTTRSRPLAG